MLMHALPWSNHRQAGTATHMCTCYDALCSMARRGLVHVGLQCWQIVRSSVRLIQLLVCMPAHEGIYYQPCVRLASLTTPLPFLQKIAGSVQLLSGFRAVCKLCTSSTSPERGPVELKGERSAESHVLGRHLEPLATKRKAHRLHLVLQKRCSRDLQ